MKTQAKVAAGLLAVVLAASAAWGWAHIGGREGVGYYVNSLLYSDDPVGAAKKACKADILSTANDPDSVQWVAEDQWLIESAASTAVEGRQDVTVKVDLRGKNAFGALILNRVVCRTSVGDGSALVFSTAHDK